MSKTFKILENYSANMAADISAASKDGYEFVSMLESGSNRYLVVLMQKDVSDV